MTKDRIEAIENQTSAAWNLVDRLLRIPASLSRVERPDEFVERAAQAAAAALEVDFDIHWFGSRSEPPPPPGPDAVRLMVAQQDATFAAIDLIGREVFSAMIRQLLQHLANDLTHGVDAITNRNIRDAQRALIALLRAESDLGQLAHDATTMCVEQTGAEAGLLLSRYAPDFRVSACTGDWPVATVAMSSWQAAAKSGIEATGAMVHPGELVTCPVAASSPARLVLLLRFPPGDAARYNRFPVLNELARTAAPYLDARRRDKVLTDLLELNHVSVATNTIELYGKVLRTAVDLIPGSGAGTLLTRQNPGEKFEYQAALGFDLQGLRANKLSEASMQAWYGPDDRGWQLGLPRILSRNEVDFEEYGHATTPGCDPLATAYGTIQSSLCLPVLRDGVVMAALNVDNLTDPGAFGNDSINLAYLFGSPLASLLHRQHTHDVLKEAALTDELTGLANRRAFDQAFSRELARAARTGSPTSVLMMDARGFKHINDRFGHDVGDEALVLMARALEKELREADFPARRGGDEFVALLVDTPAAEVAAVARRVQDAISSITIRDDLQLTVDIGLATAPTDGDTPAELLRTADERMYAEKLRAR